MPRKPELTQEQWCAAQEERNAARLAKAVEPAPVSVPLDPSIRVEFATLESIATAAQLIDKIGVEEANRIFHVGPSTPPPALSENLESEKPLSIPIPEKAFYGLSGRIIEKLRPNTESHPMGNLLLFLSGFGNIIGPTAYYEVEDTKHYGNLFVVTVGKSAKSRKGTGQNRINRIISALDQTWFNTRRTSGLGSGEIVVYQVRDEQKELLPDKKTGEVKAVITDYGVRDKRLLVDESEFASVLAVSGRENSTLSNILRSAWDHKDIRNMAKGGSSVCLNPHISVTANITREELNIQLREADRFNGFGNRFLWCYVERQALLPDGGEEIDWSDEILELIKCVEYASTRKRVYMEPNARKMWARIYTDLSKEEPGIVGAVTSRSEAQVLRIALLFAMLDCSEYITSDHLGAAHEVWDYCENSARVIFGGISKEQWRILVSLDGGPKTVTAIVQGAFQKHRTVEDVQKDLDRLLSLHKIAEKKNEQGKSIYTLRGEL